MDSALYQRFFDVEDTYWWSVWVRRTMLDWLPDGPASRRILDLGCGTGILSQDLRDRGTVTSFDYAEEALAFCRKRHLTRLVRGDAHTLPFPDACVDLVLALDTLEHLQDDAEALREVRRVLRPTGTLILNVPALQMLWSSHDVANQHFRRYDHRRLRQVLEATGFHVTKLTYTNMLLFPPTLVVRLGKRLFGGTAAPADEILSLPPGLNAALIGLMDLERRLVRHINLPVGTSLFAVATPA